MILVKKAIVQLPNRPANYLKLSWSLLKILKKFELNTCFYTTVPENIDLLTSDFQKCKLKTTSHLLQSDLGIRFFMGFKKSAPIDVSKMDAEELDDTLQQLLSKNKDKQIEQIVNDCCNIRKFINELMLKKLFRNYSMAGRPDMVVLFQKYCSRVDPNLYNRNGEFMHYLAKAQCFRGNSEKGLLILMDTYKKYESLRSFYRIILRELIQDSVLNRSEASLVIFKKYVLKFSKKWDENYPLVCLWHICWSSSWFSDQVLSDELLETSKALRDIVKDRATAFSINILKQDYNEDAVMRLLQTLLKYDMMVEYAKVLQVLFNYKLRIKDVRGCSEIIRNCETLGINLPSNQQGRYIKMLIEGKTDEHKGTAEPKDFKLKF